MELFTLGFELGKTRFHLVGMNQRGEGVLRKRFSRAQLLHLTANLKVELIGMEACGDRISGASVAGARAQGTADPGGICEALRQDEHERLHRRRSDRRSGGKTDHAFCAGQE